MDVNDDRGFAQFFGEALVFAAQVLVLFVERVAFRLVGPRFWGVRARKMPAARSRREVTKWEE